MQINGKKTEHRKWLLWICVGALTAGLVALGIWAAVGSRRPQPAQQIQSVESEPTEPEPSQTEEPGSGIPMLDIPENPYGPEDFVQQEGYLTCTAGPCMLGVDVSAWQEEIDWAAVKEAGMEFAMLRLAWRGTSEGGIYADDRAEENYLGAKAAGLQVGGYFFSQAITPEEAREEARFLLDMIKQWELELPIVFDWEFVDGSRTEGVDAETLTACAEAFCRTVAEAGYRPMVYFNPVMAYYQLDLEALEEFDFWLAMWQQEMDFPYKVNMWQYTDEGTVPGIEGEVDLDIYFIYEDA